MKTTRLAKAVALSAALASAMHSHAADSSARSETAPVIVKVVADEADRTGEWSEAGTDVQAAITAAGEGGTVYFRAGVYRFAETLNLTAANQKLVGESRAERRKPIVRPRVGPAVFRVVTLSMPGTMTNCG